MQRLNQPVLPADQRIKPQESTGDLSSSVGSQRAAKLDEAARLQELPTWSNAPKELLASNVRNSARTDFTRTAKFSNNAPAVVLATSGPMAPVQPDPGKAALSQGQVKPQDATQAMIQAITSHQIVMFGETHGNKQEYEWLNRLVKTPAFADRVDDIVVEFGNSLYQKTVDRYIAGEDIPQAQVERAWRNMIGAVGTISPVYGLFYRAVRESNLERHDGHKIRLLLGDPYGDWSQIHNAADLGPYLVREFGAEEATFEETFRSDDGEGYVMADAFGLFIGEKVTGGCLEELQHLGVLPRGGVGDVDDR